MEPENFEFEKTPLDMIECFSRCGNFPRTVEGIQFLAHGLVKASQETGVPMQIIVEACASMSNYCPTDAELLNVGRNIHREMSEQIEAKRDREAEWARQYGKANPYDWKAEAAKIMPQASAHWKKDRAMVKLMRDQLTHQGAKFKNLGYQDRLALQIWAQDQIGIEVTASQRKDVGELVWDSNHGAAR